MSERLWVQRCTSELPRGAQPAQRSQHCPCRSWPCPGFSSWGKQRKNQPDPAWMDSRGLVRWLHKSTIPRSQSLCILPMRAPLNLATDAALATAMKPPCGNTSLPGDIGFDRSGAGAAASCLRCWAMGTRAAAEKEQEETGTEAAASARAALSRKGIPSNRLQPLACWTQQTPPGPVSVPTLTGLHASLGAGSQEEAEPEQPVRTGL